MNSIINHDMNNKIASLRPCPFRKLANLFANVTAPVDKTKILPALGEPKHQSPQLALNKLADSLDSLAHYPVTHGLSELTAQQPGADFYLWAETPINDEDFAQQLYANENIVVLPGSYLSRNTEQGNPGANHIRMALVANVEKSIDATKRIKHFIETIYTILFY